MYLIIAYRGQHWKGKQNRILKEKIEGKSSGVKPFAIKIAKAFNYCKKWQVAGPFLTQGYEIGM